MEEQLCFFDAVQGHIEIVKMLLRAGADVNHSDKVLPH
jgi:hypothetical protein